MTPRWHAAIYYRTDAEPLIVEYDVEELVELQALVERGPDWNTIEKIVVTLARPTSIGMTLGNLETTGVTLTIGSAA